MKAKLIAVFAATVALVVVIHAQTMVEYSNLSAHAANSLSAPIEKPRIARQKTGGEKLQLRNQVVGYSPVLVCAETEDIIKVSIFQRDLLSRMSFVMS